MIHDITESKIVKVEQRKWRVIEVTKFNFGKIKLTAILAEESIFAAKYLHSLNPVDIFNWLLLYEKSTEVQWYFTF